MTQSRSLLVVVAHPDDESFGFGGTLARYASEDVAVHVAVATGGEGGTVEPEMLKGYQSIAELRRSELEQAGRILGLASLTLLGFQDSGMIGDQPGTLAQTPVEQVAEPIVALIRKVRPQVIITHDPNGDYGHPDHKAVNRATLLAFTAAGDPQRFPDQLASGLQPWVPQKLYYGSIPRAALRFAVRAMPLFKRDPTRFGRNNDINLVTVANFPGETTTIVDISRYLGVKAKAGASHRSQGGGAGPSVPAPLRRLVFGREAYSRAIPPPLPGERERDLFAGVRLD